MIIWLLLISIILVLLIVVFLSVPWAEKKALFLPSKKQVWSPSYEYKNVYIDAKNPSILYKNRPSDNCKRNYIHGWYFNNFYGNKTVMYCHGNSLNISNREYIINICEKFKLNLFIFDYRGFGESSHEPSKRNLRKDGEAAYYFVRKHCGIKSKDIIIWGESLGGAAAIWTASKYKCGALILLATFSGLDDAIGNYFDSNLAKSLATGYGNLASLRYDIIPTRSFIRKVKCPVVIMHSKTDDVIPYACAKILHKNINHKDKLLITIKGTHSAPIIRRDQFKNVFEFCNIPYEEPDDIDEILKELETVAEKHHNFIER